MPICYLKVMKITSLLIGFSIFLAACSTSRVAPIPEVPVVAPRATLNLRELQNRLGIELGPEGTGFREKSFDACDLGDALNDLRNPVKDCRQVYFALVQFQLSCRQSEQPTEALTDADLTPVKNQKLKWQLGKEAGETETDFQGRGVIRVLSGVPIKKSFLRLSTGVDFLNMRVEQVTAIVTPPSWCK
jgi:hypothetical protein